MGFEIGREKTGGRKAGVGNRATAEFKAFWQEFLESTEYQDNLKSRVLAGKADHMEKYLAELLHGRPRQEADPNGLEGIQVVILPASASVPVGSLDDVPSRTARRTLLEHVTSNGEEDR